MTDIDLGTLNISGRELCSLNQEDFFQRVPRGEILWSHLELLRKCMIGVIIYLYCNLSLILFFYLCYRNCLLIIAIIFNIY